MTNITSHAHRFSLRNHRCCHKSITSVELPALRDRRIAARAAARSSSSPVPSEQGRKWLKPKNSRLLSRTTNGCGAYTLVFNYEEELLALQRAEDEARSRAPGLPPSEEVDTLVGECDSASEENSSETCWRDSVPSKGLGLGGPIPPGR